MNPYYYTANSLQEMFKRMVETDKRSITGHMHVLQDYASRCDVVCEFGIRAGNSTVALLTGCKGTVHSWDIQEIPQWHGPIRKLAGDKWIPHYEDSTTCEIPECDFLFHDSMHTYDHVKAEIDRHAKKVRRYYGFHDTVSNATRGAHIGPQVGTKMPVTLLKEGTGIRRAIDEMIATGEWAVCHEVEHSDGMMILERR